MRPFAFPLVMAAGLLLPAALHAEVYQFIVSNEGDAPIVALHAVGFEGEAYEDILGGDDIEPGESDSVAFDVDSDDCQGDLIVEFGDGTQDAAEDVDLCNDDDYAFSN